MNAERWSEALGDPPHVPLRIRPASGSRQDFLPDACVTLLSRKATVGLLKAHVCKTLELPLGAANLMHEGKDLDDSKTLTENSITLPGPAARRRGEMAEIFVDLTYVEMVRQQTALQHAQEMMEQARKAEEARKIAELRAEEKRIADLLRWEQTRMQREETLQRAQAQKLLEDKEAAEAEVLASLPMELRRIEYTVDWGIIVEQRLREIARQAAISLQECANKVSIVTGRGALIEMFAGGDTVVPTKQDFPIVLVFGPVTVQVQGPTHQQLAAFARSETTLLPMCWEEAKGDGRIMLHSSEAEFSAVSAYFRGTLGWLPAIVSIERIQNKHVYSKFKGINESGLTMMFHGCRSQPNEDSIVNNGFLVSKCRSGGSNFGTWCAYAASYSDSGFVFQESSGLKHIFVVAVSRANIKMDNPTMRVVGQNCAYPLWLVKYRSSATRPSRSRYGY